jgi:hypothetical protein
VKAEYRVEARVRVGEIEDIGQNEPLCRMLFSRKCERVVTRVATLIGAIAQPSGSATQIEHARTVARQVLVENSSLLPVEKPAV